MRAGLKTKLKSIVFVSLLTLTGLTLAGCQRQEEADTTAQSPEADLRALHERLLIVDTHVDIGAHYATHELDPGGLTSAQVDLPKMRAGGIDAAFFIVYVRQGPLTPEGFASARQAAEDKYQAIDRMIRSYPDQIALARTADDVEAIAANGRRVALMGMENAYPLGLNVDDIPFWAERGVRYVSLTHFGNNQFGGSSDPNVEMGESEIDPGISELGRELVTALNDNGIMVDVSHVGRTTMMEALELSRAPIIASHSGAFAVFENARNLDDEQLRAIRDNGGVAQMVAFRSYVHARTQEHDQEVAALRARLGLETRQSRMHAAPELRQAYREEFLALRARFPDVTVAHFVDHIDHAVSVAGTDHVGIASDFDGGGGVLGWDNASQTLEVTRELVNRGYSEEDMAQLWGGNVLRVMRAVEAVAR